MDKENKTDVKQSPVKRVDPENPKIKSVFVTLLSRLTISPLNQPNSVVKEVKQTMA